MAYENLLPGHMLTEEDVTGVLRQGEDCVEWMNGCVRRIASPRITYEEMIASRSLRGMQVGEKIPGRKSGDCDPVFQVWQESEKYIREEQAYAKRQERNARYAEMQIRKIWDAFYHLDPEMQRILRMFYVERMNVHEVSEKLGVSEATFWRRRRKAVRQILRDCSGEQARSKRYVDNTAGEMI